jgi:hypothetical protein
MMRGILCTKEDGGVAVIWPTHYAYARTTGGGLQLPYPRQICIDNLVRNGRRPSFAKRWVDSALSGGMTDAEFYAAIIEKDMPKNWSAPELIDLAPKDRWFRDAWQRSHNGGPISIDLHRAKRVQAAHVRAACKSTDPLSEDLDPFPFIHRIKLARDLAELRSIHP